MNRLIHQTSPYLLQHAHNPVDWFPWGEEAIAKARAENKPIFLSIGYSACHWCHVMERESFENEDIAAVMNQHFVCIKLDREERPDLDKIYMTAVQVTTGGGGWPMSVWLTPDLKPFYCGTYYPPPTFLQLLHRISEIWKTNPDGIRDQATQITTTLAQHTLNADDASPLDNAPLHRALEQFRSVYDPLHGGFGGAPKFPRPVVINFLLRTSGRDMALHTLRQMANGGLFDQLGGGFHRYSVDNQWLVSHFEKMLYDQAQLITACCDAFQITSDPFYADIARRTGDYVLHDMTSPDGAFYSAEDADSEGVEGKFYVWTRAEIQQILEDRTVAFCQSHGVTANGNWEQGLNILHIVEPGAFARERAQLLAIREHRIRPHRDDKILTSWNGLMISALSRAAQTLDEPRYRHAAQQAAGHIRARHLKDGKLSRTSTVPAVLDDYACFATGLLDLYETDFDARWLQHATDLANTMLQLFQDPIGGGFFMTTGADPNVIVRLKKDYDGAEPSGNSVAALLLLRLASFTGNDAYEKAALRTLAAFDQLLHRLPHAVPQMLCALDFHLAGVVEITMHGLLTAADTQALLRVVHATFLPNRVLRMVTEETPATAQVCVNRVCQRPVSGASQLQKLLEQPAGDV
jgi:uncharacterized protein YyaL (SSP411 family)